MTKEYQVRVIDKTFTSHFVAADSKEEAIRMAKRERAMHDYCGEEQFLSEEIEVVGYSVVDGTELEQFYVEANNTTIIWEYTYQNSDCIAERIVGYYHGKPNEKDMKEHSYKGIETRF